MVKMYRGSFNIEELLDKKLKINNQVINNKIYIKLKI